MPAQWIWNFGDYEIYHSLLLHARRQEFGHEYPAMWHTDSPEKTVSFRTEVDAPQGGYLIAHVCGKGYVEYQGGSIPPACGWRSRQANILSTSAWSM